jgi:hypothetical protein
MRSLKPGDRVIVKVLAQIPELGENLELSFPGTVDRALSPPADEWEDPAYWVIVDLGEKTNRSRLHQRNLTLINPLTTTVEEFESQMQSIRNCLQESPEYYAGAGGDLGDIGALFFVGEAAPLESFFKRLTDASLTVSDHVADDSGGPWLVVNVHSAEDTYTLARIYQGDLVCKTV